MANTEKIIFDIYNILSQMRYPKIATATVEDIESTILKGKNRISLLSWLLIKNSPSTVIELEKLEGPVLEDKLYEYYSGIGICIDKQLLLRNWTWQEQSFTLKLLLDFMKCTHSDSFNVDYIQEEYSNDILNGYINKDSNSITSNTDLNQSYFESLLYFDNLKKYMNKHEQLMCNYESQKEKHTEEGEKKIENGLLFNTRIKKFVQTYSTIQSQLETNVKGANNNLHSTHNDIMEICSSFSSVTKLLQARERILNPTVPEDINKTTTLLNGIIENIISSSEEVLNIYKT